MISIWGEDRGIRDLELTKGLHEILLVRLVSKSGDMTINWRPPGTKELVPVPDNILFHDPANKRPPPIPGLNKP